MECDLSEAMKKTVGTSFEQSDLKHMLHQILSAVNHIHEKWYIHRDLKTSNILVHKSGKICICDFGLARKYENPLKALTQLVVTLWYRSPELLFGENIYGPEVDMWSIGCIFAELITKKVLWIEDNCSGNTNTLLHTSGYFSREEMAFAFKIYSL